MNNHYEIKYAVKGKDGKTYWNRCGTLFPAKSGEGFNIILDAVPVPQEAGSLRLAAFPPKPRDGAQSQSRPSNDLDDEIPF